MGLWAARDCSSFWTRRVSLELKGGSQFLDKGQCPETEPGPAKPWPRLPGEGRPWGQGPSDFTNHKYHCWGALRASSACVCPSVWSPQTAHMGHIYLFPSTGRFFVPWPMCEPENAQLGRSLFIIAYLDFCLQPWPTVALAGIWGAGILSDSSGNRPLVSPKCQWRKEVQLPSGRERLLGPRKKEYSGRSRGNQAPSWRNCCCRQVPQGRAAPHFHRQALQRARFLPWIQSRRTVVRPEP